MSKRHPHVLIPTIGRLHTMHFVELNDTEGSDPHHKEGLPSQENANASNIGALMIRIGFWGPLYFNFK